MKSNTNQLGEWMRDGLRDIGKNQAWLAEKVGVQPPQISRIISGSSEATPDLLSAIADALGKPRIQAYRVAGFLEKLPEGDAWVEEMTYKIKVMPTTYRTVISKFINALLEGEGLEHSVQKTKPAKKGV